MINKFETFKATRWHITYTNEIGKSYDFRYVYGQISFESKDSADRECARLIKSHNPEKSSNEDYTVEEYIANVLLKPISIE